MHFSLFLIYVCFLVMLCTSAEFYMYILECRSPQKSAMWCNRWLTHACQFHWSYCYPSQRRIGPRLFIGFSPTAAGIAKMTCLANKTNYPIKNG